MPTSSSEVQNLFSPTTWTFSPQTVKIKLDIFLTHTLSLTQMTQKTQRSKFEIHLHHKMAILLLLVDAACGGFHSVTLFQSLNFEWPTIQTLHITKKIMGVVVSATNNMANCAPWPQPNFKFWAKDLSYCFCQALCYFLLSGTKGDSLASLHKSKGAASLHKQIGATSQYKSISATSGTDASHWVLHLHKQYRSAASCTSQWYCIPVKSIGVASQCIRMGAASGISTQMLHPCTSQCAASWHKFMNAASMHSWAGAASLYMTKKLAHEQFGVVVTSYTLRWLSWINKHTSRWYNLFACTCFCECLVALWRGFGLSCGDHQLPTGGPVGTGQNTHATQVTTWDAPRCPQHHLSCAGVWGAMHPCKLSGLDLALHNLCTPSCRDSMRNAAQALCEPEATFILSWHQLQSSTSSSKIHTSPLKSTAKIITNHSWLELAKLNVKRDIEMLLDICNWLLLFAVNCKTLDQCWPNIKTTCCEHGKKWQMQSAVDVNVTNMKTPEHLQHGIQCLTWKPSCTWLSPKCNRWHHSSEPCVHIAPQDTLHVNPALRCKVWCMCPAFSTKNYMNSGLLIEHVLQHMQM